MLRLAGLGERRASTEAILAAWGSAERARERLGRGEYSTSESLLDRFRLRG
jgi:hypothetical protein